MYTAKRHGKNRFEKFETEIASGLLAKLDLETAMRRGLDGDEFSVHYQPIVDLATGAIVGAEALARWDSAEHGSIPPVTFIPLAEDIGLIGELGGRVLESACAQVAEWQREALVAADFTVSVNLSTRQLDDHDLVERVAVVLRRTGLSPSNLVLEITESGVMSVDDKNVRILTSLRALGVKIAIDDFGTGYSSLSYLQHFPVDILKIDRSFVSAIQAGTTETSLAPTIVSLAETLKLRVVAEGVETELQADTLNGLGCQLAQGYYFARPADSQTMHQLLTREQLGRSDALV
jgi:EAL domain-containing protein (putative c-di-GMP-specific phosphodiesterase class I)